MNKREALTEKIKAAVTRTRTPLEVAGQQVVQQGNYIELKLSDAEELLRQLGEEWVSLR
jgi:hypothetical protein